jgi:hypothetical protein
MTAKELAGPLDARKRWLLVLMLIALVAGAASTWWTVWRRDYEMRVQLLAQTRRVAPALDPRTWHRSPAPKPTWSRPPTTG